MKPFNQTPKGWVVTLMLVLLSNLAYAANVTIRVKKGDGSPYPGIGATYQGGYLLTFGTTDVNGEVTKSIPDGSYTFKVSVNGTSATITQAVSGDVTLDFNTTTVIAKVAACNSAGVSGATIQYNTGYLYSFPNTDANGESSREMFAGNYDLTAKYKGTSLTQNVNVPSGQPTVVNFQATTVTIANTGNKTYQSGYVYTANGTIYMFPGTYPFTFPGGFVADLNISGCTKNITVNFLTLKDHSGAPLAGGTGRGGTGSSFSSFNITNGPTNASGYAYDVRNTPAPNTIMSYQMSYNNTNEVVTQNVSTNNVFNFQTNLITMRLETCDGTGLSGGSVRYGGGNSFGTWYFPSPNSTDANGEMSAEMFPGTFSFQMNYQASSEVKSSVAIPDANTTLTWKTTNVTLKWPNAISFGGSGDARFFNKPSMELLPGTLNFNFRTPGNNYAALDISGCSMTVTPGLITLKNSDGGPIAGGSVDGYQGGWSTYGLTNANGRLLVIGKNPTSIKMWLGGGAVQQNGINFASDPFVDFQTVEVTMDLKDADGNYGLEGDNLQYYAGGWKTFGSGTTTSSKETMEMLPASYSFKMGHEGSLHQISNQNVGVNPLVSYQTTRINMLLRDMSLTPILGGVATYYAGGWKSAGLTDASGIASLQLLPGNYSFKMQHDGKYLQKNLPVGATTMEIEFYYNGSAILGTNAPSIRMVQSVEAVAFNVYPNPANGSVSVSFTGVSENQVSIKLADISGRVVFNKNITAAEGANVEMIDLSNIPAGSYILSFENGEQKEAKKLLVQH